MINEHIIYEMRGWLSDCGVATAYDMPVLNVLALVKRGYAGGLDAFIADQEDW